MSTSVLGLLKSLRETKFFNSVFLIDFEEKTGAALFAARVPRSVAPAFRRAFLARFKHRAFSDGALEMILQEVLQEGLVDTPSLWVELPSTYQCDPDAPELPETVFLALPPKKKPSRASSKTRAWRKHIEGEPPHGVPGHETLRSRRRREEERGRQTDTEFMGRSGYLAFAADSDSEWPTREPTPEAAPVFAAIEAVLKNQSLSQSELAAHLNRLGLKTIGGKKFTRTMMSRLIIFFELLLGGRAP